jgi:diacylglycerol kinase (ATP)
MPEGAKTAFLIYNPASGRRRHRRFAEIEQAVAILKESGVIVEVAATSAPGSGTSLARLAVEQRLDLVIACGGDGTINEIVNGLAGSTVPMALLPAGTANILAKEIGVPWDIPHAARLIAGGTVRRIALGLAVAPNGHVSEFVPPGGRYFLCVAGAGPDGAMVNDVDEILKKNAGILAYWIEGFRQVFRYGFPELSVHSGGREHRATLIVIGRTAHYGGPLKITTGASLFEDSFEFLTISGRSRWNYIACFPALWFGTLRKRPEVEAWKATEAVCRAATSESVYAQVDGEPVGPLPLAFRIVPDALSLVIPAAR